MYLTRLRITALRCLAEVDLSPGPGLNLLVGANGAGKTSVLEAIHLLGYGRSFRGRVRDGLVRSGADALELFAQWQSPVDAIEHKGGVRHTGQQWTARLDGQPVAQLGDLCAAFAAITFEPGSHALIDGGAEARRRYLDWGLFHVEQDDEPRFLHTWRRYARALKQRNASLKQQAGDSVLDAWDRELAQAGEGIDRQRAAYLERLQPWMRRVSNDLTPALGEARMAYRPGWRQQDLSLADALLVQRERDRAAGFTSVGPHRADWSVHHSARPGDEALSRGQAKLTALACLLAQGEDFAAVRGHWPVVLLDDYAAELDREHQARLIARLTASQAQVFLTGTDVRIEPDSGITVFHVEHGAVTPH